jgi:hypothetical protein
MASTAWHAPALPTNQKPIPEVYLGNDLGVLQFARAISIRPLEAMCYFEAQLKHFEAHLLPEVLKSSSIKGEISALRLKEYGLVPLYPKGTFHRGAPVENWHYRQLGEKSFSLYIDAENAFALTYRDIPQLIIGFERSGVSICNFEQIQLVHAYVRGNEGKIQRPGPDGLYRFQIDSLKVNLVESWASMNMCDHVLVVAGGFQRSAIDSASTFSESQAKRMYDSVFLSAGYELLPFKNTTYLYKKFS